MDEGSGTDDALISRRYNTPAVFDEKPLWDSRNNTSTLVPDPLLKKFNGASRVT